MKKLIILAAIVFAAGVQADVIMDSTTLNGSFESGTGVLFNQQPNWWNAGTGDQTQTAASTGLNLAGSTYNGVISDSNLGGNVLHSVNSGYTIQSGDVFTIGYDWRDAFGWEANDQVRVALVAYSTDTLAGTEVWREWVNDKVTTVGAWESVTGEISNLTGAVGRTLFIQAYGVNGGAGSGDFARIDNITVDVIPEPATLSLIATFGGVLLIRRKLRL